MSLGHPWGTFLYTAGTVIAHANGPTPTKCHEVSRIIVV